LQSKGEIVVVEVEFLVFGGELWRGWLGYDIGACGRSRCGGGIEVIEDVYELEKLLKVAPLIPSRSSRSSSSCCVAISQTFVIPRGREWQLKLKFS
jgi:hypothetical protein